MSHLTPWKVLSSKSIHTTPWMEVKEDRCLAGGAELTYTYARRRDEGPMIVAEDDDERLWMVRQYRHPIQKILWQFHAEGKHAGESWEAAAARGLNEELSLHAAELTDLGQFYVDPGGLEQKFHLFVARNLSATAETHQPQALGEVEELETRAFSRSEIDALIESGDIADNWTLASLFLYDRWKRAIL